MINFAAPSLISSLIWPARVVSLILLSVFRFLHVSHGTLITLIYQLIDSFRTWDPELVDPSETSIFITGCASGFGLSLASRLDRMGYTVFAGVRVLDQRSAELKTSSSDRLRIVKCDVADKEEIQNAYNFIQENLNGTQLRAVVNNAGVISVMPFEWRQEHESELVINLMAPMNISRIFLPLLRQTPGSRIVFVSSLAARFPLFASSVYCGSKAGLTAFATCLSRELRHQNVFVSIVEPGSYETAMNNHDYSAIDRTFESLPGEIRGSYDSHFFAELEIDKNTHTCSTTADHTPLIDQLVRSAASKSPPDLLVGVTSFTESLSVMLAENVPINVLLRGMNMAIPVLQKFGFLSIGSNSR